MKTATERTMKLIEEPILYVACDGCYFAGWWDESPPAARFPPGGGVRFPKFRAPDVWLEYRGSEAAMVDTLKAAKILPASGWSSRPVPREWAAEGVRLGASSKKKKRPEKPSPEVGGLFAPELVGKVEHKPWDQRIASTPDEAMAMGRARATKAGYEAWKKDREAAKNKDGEPF